MSTIGVSALARVLILGGAGFIGYHLTKHLAENSSHQITIVDNLSRGELDQDLDTLLHRHPSVQLQVGDLTEMDVYSRLEGPFQQVYLLAGMVGVANVLEAPSRVIRTNTAIIFNALDWLAQTGCQRVLFASTSETYAGSVELGLAPVPTGEDVPLAVIDVQHPRFTYALTKMMGEAAVTHAARDCGRQDLIVRFHNVYGPRMGMSHVVPELMQRVHRQMDPFPVYGLDQTRAFCYVGDAARACTSLMEPDLALDATPIVNIGNDREEVRIAELLERLLDVTGFHPEIENFQAASGGVARRCPDISKLRALTGFVPEIDLNEGLALTWEWYQRRLDAEATAAAASAIPDTATAPTTMPR